MKITFLIIALILASNPVSAKTLVVLLDGTWNEEEQDGVYADKKKQKQVTNTNVVLLKKYITENNASGDSVQTVKYLEGVGVTDNRIERIQEGVFGKGVIKKVNDAYDFLKNEYQTNDYIAIFGFSRGAATARLLSQKIATERFDMGEDTPVEIGFLGLWDTVVAIGFPKFDFEQFKKIYPNMKKQVQIPEIVKKVVHLVALDEQRATFAPALLSFAPDPSVVDAHEIWFTGSHGDVGGGWKAAPADSVKLSDLALYCMIEAAQSDELNFNMQEANELYQAIQSSSFTTLPLHLAEGIRSYGGKETRDFHTASEKSDARVSIHISVLNRLYENESYRPDNMDASVTNLAEQYNIIESCSSLPKSE